MLSLPLLADCNIRLSKKPDDLVRAMSRATVQKLTGNICPPGLPFPFGDLPVELKSYILSFTDLIAPHDLIYSFDTGLQPYAFWRRYGAIARGNINKCIWPPNIKYQSRFMDVFTGCMDCDSQRASVILSECKLWHMPSQLFLVSRSVSELSYQIFFARNHFVLLSLSSSSEEQKRNDPWKFRGLASTLFWRLRPSSWIWLRNIEFVFRVGEHRTYIPDRLDRDEWANTVNTLCSSRGLGSFSIESLNLTLVICFLQKDDGWHPSDKEWMKRIGRGLTEPMRKATCLQALRSFQVIYVQKLGDGHEEHPFLGGCKELEAELEAQVLGERYNSVKDQNRGEARKKAREKWVERVYCDKDWWWGPLAVDMPARYDED